MRRLIATLGLLLALGGMAPAQSLRVNVQSAGVRPGQAATLNDAALARLVDAQPDGLKDKGQTYDLFFPSDLRNYAISRPLNPDRDCLRLVGDGAGSRLVMTGRADPAVMLGFGRRPGGKGLTADHAFDLWNRLDATVASGPGQRWGFWTHDDTHLSQFSAGLAVLPADLATLRIEYAYDSTATGEHSAPIAGQDGRWYLIDGPTCEVWAYTRTDPYGPSSRNRFLFPGPTTGPGVHRISVQVDLPNVAATAFVDGLQVAVRVDRKAPPPPDGTTIRLAPDEARPFGLGGVAPTSSTHGNDWWGGDQSYDRAICGFALHSSAVYADDGTGQPQRRLDGRAITDRLRYQDSEATDLIGLLPGTDAPGGDRWNDRLLTVVGNQALPYRRSSAFVMAKEHNRAGLRTFGIDRMTIESPGDCIAVGAALGMDFRDSSFKAGETGRAIGSWNFGASYLHRARHCSLQGGAAALYSYLGMWDCDTINVPVHGRNTFWLVDTSASIRHVFSTGHGEPERIVYAVGCPRLAIADFAVDIEDFEHPKVAVIEALTSIDAGERMERVRVRDLAVGGLRPGIPLVRLGVLAGHPDRPARFDLSDLSIDAGAELFDSFVRVESRGWTGTVDVDYEHPTPIKGTFGGEPRVKRVGPSEPSIPGRMPEGP